ncbi:MAG: DUF4331 family protein [Bacteroidota bacterium]
MLGISLMASSHREAPLIASDPTADNVDLYAFRSPDDPNTVTIIATYIPMQLPFAGPNYYNFDPSVRYEIHIDNDVTTTGDDITYRFTFTQVNEDPTTFFNIRLGQQNLKTTYRLEKITAAGTEVIVENGVVPPNNIGPRSITGGAGLNTTYNALFTGAITTATTGAKVYAGPTDDPFFVDLGGVFDLGNSPRQEGGSRDDLACMNVHALAIQVPIASLSKTGTNTPTNILDGDYTIGVWASASRPRMTVFSATADPTYSGDFVQVSRLGMPLTNEVVIPVGQKDQWNAVSPYDAAEASFYENFYNPELALYMDDDQFGAAVPSFSPLRIQTNSLGMFDFSNGADGLFALKGTDAVAGTAFEAFPDLLLPGAGQPRSVDIWPAFHTGVPNVPPYQLATGKEGNPLAAGKPFANNFLPNGGDMLRLNMAVPVTPRTDANFSSLGLIQAAAIGLTVAPFNTSDSLEFLPNMDGFPNGRRLEDDVTRIELQAVGGVVLAAIGLWYDDYDPASSASPVTQDLLNVLTYTTGVESNDKPFTGVFPYLAQPHSGTGECSGFIVNDPPPPPMNPDFAATDAQIFSGSNTSGLVSVYGITGDSIFSSTFAAAGMDADGVHYDEENDIVYQINRTDNVINSYTNVLGALSAGDMPGMGATSTSDFTNGREITASGDRLVVAQDAADSNDGNKFLIYQVSDNGITLQKTLTSPINLWGIDAFGETMYAIEDNSDRLVVYENFFDMTGTAMATRTITIENMIRTHGLVYWPNTDMMILTDVGDGASDDNDGAIIVVRGFTAAAADGTITSAEQVRIAGDATFLANPVDVAIDINKMMIYVAERKNAGGRILGFAMPTESGEFAPTYNVESPGAASVYLNGNPPEMAPPTGGGDDCAAPMVTNVDLQSPRKTRVTWSAVDDAQRYQFQIRFKGMERWLVTARVRNTSVAIFAPSGRTYEFRIASICDGEAGEYGPIMEYTSEAGFVSTTATSRSREITNEESIFIEGEDLSVFPNPVSQNLTVQYKTKTTGTMELFHVSGKRVKNIPLRAGNSTYNVEMNDLADGLYLLRIVEAGQPPITQQVIKQAFK